MNPILSLNLSPYRVFMINRTSPPFKMNTRNIIRRSLSLANIFYSGEETIVKNTSLLSKMALDLLSIFLIFAECERVFSSAKILITNHQNGLKEDIIQAYTLLQWWFKDVGFK